MSEYILNYVQWQIAIKNINTLREMSDFLVSKASEERKEALYMQVQPLLATQFPAGDSFPTNNTHRKHKLVQSFPKISRKRGKKQTTEIETNSKPLLQELVEDIADDCWLYLLTIPMSQFSDALKYFNQEERDVLLEKHEEAQTAWSCTICEQISLEGIKTGYINCSQ